MSQKRKSVSIYGICTISVLLLFVYISYTCERMEPVRINKVSKVSISNIDYNSCLVRSTIIDISTNGIDQHGFCWAISQNPTASDNKNQLASISSKISFTSNLTNLTANTKYYVRAYAQNEDGILYGEESDFTTPSNTKAQISTLVVGSITKNSAQCGGNITDDGGLPVTEKGVCWNATGNPDIEDDKLSNESATDSFICNITGLLEWTTYFIRAYATNSEGTSYGEMEYFTTLGTVVDYDGNTYDAIKMGNQIWMAENLSTTHYASGKALINGIGVGDLSGDFITEYYFTYDDNESNAEIYGRLYTWAAIMNGAESSDDNPSMVQGACPAGWHVPSDSEWKELELYLGMSQEEVDDEGVRGENAGAKLKSTEGWNSEGYGTNETGFTAIPAGIRRYHSFAFLGERADFWTATENTDSLAWHRSLNFEHSEILRTSDYLKHASRSLRCIKGIVLPTVITNSPIDVIESTATVSGEVTADGGSPLIDRGVYYGKLPNPELSGGTKLPIENGIGEFVAYLTGLSKSTKYYVKAYATNNLGTVYGRQYEFNTLQVIFTSEIKDSWDSYATAGGENVSLNELIASEKGVCWSTSANPTIDDNKLVYDYGSSGELPFSLEITGLEQGTLYHVRAYVITNAGTFYGQDVSFTTESIGAVTTASVSSITHNSAVSGGNVISEGSGIVNARGICWNTSGNPTLEDPHTIDGDGLGSFVSNMNGLSELTTYYVRAYASNELGTAFGEEETFSTEDNP